MFVKCNYSGTWSWVSQTAYHSWERRCAYCLVLVSAVPVECLIGDIKPYSSMSSSSTALSDERPSAVGATSAAGALEPPKSA